MPRKADCAGAASSYQNVAAEPPSKRKGHLVRRQKANPSNRVRASCPNSAISELAWRLAKRCRNVVQACLREEEWRDADREFHAVILRGLTQRVKCEQEW